MKRYDLFNALDFVDEDLAVRAQDLMSGECKTSRRIVGKRLVLAAACLCLCFSVLILSIPRRDPNINYDISPTHTIGTYEISDFPQRTYLYGDAVGIPLLTTDPGCQFNYINGIAVVATVVEVLSDEYSDPVLTKTYEKNGIDTFEYSLADWEKDLDFRFHILRLRVQEVIVGENVPQEIYYMLPSYASTDLLDYQKMIFFLSQRGCGEYVLVNETQGRAEAFSPMFSSCKWYSPYSHVGTVMAFSNGRLDVGLWDKEGWLVSYENDYFWGGCTLEDFLQKDKSSSMFDYPVYEGCSFNRAVRLIKKKYAQNDIYATSNFGFVSLEELYIPGAEATLAFVKPFENGTFAHYKDGKNLGYFRVINGFITREEINIDMDTDEIVRSGEAFTEQEIQDLPDLSQFLDQLDLSTLQTGHLTPEVMTDLELSFCRTTAWYSKYNGQAYGVVKVFWQYKKADKVHHYVATYYDDLYYLLSADGEVRIVDREELRTYIGDDREIESFEYNTSQNFYRGYN